jgi:hypothetical protein
MRTQLKPFNLSKALAGVPVVTKGGHRVLNIAHLPQAISYSRVQAVLEGVVGNNVQSYDETGHAGSGLYDLFMATKEKTVWINLYGNNGAAHHDSEQEADKYALNQYRLGGKAYPITYEE